MVSFKTVVRKKRANGFYPVYIRIVHHSKMGYIKTDKLVNEKQVCKSGEIKDAIVNAFCSQLIMEYNDIINKTDVSSMSVSELIEHLSHKEDAVCFSEYAMYVVK